MVSERSKKIDYLNRRLKTLARKGARPREIMAMFSENLQFKQMSDKQLDRVYKKVKAVKATKVINGKIVETAYLSKLRAYYGESFDERLATSFAKRNRSVIYHMRDANRAKQEAIARYERTKREYIRMYDDIVKQAKLSPTGEKLAKQARNKLRTMKRSDFKRFISGADSSAVSFENLNYLANSPDKVEQAAKDEGIDEDVFASEVSKITKATLNYQKRF